MENHLEAEANIIAPQVSAGSRCGLDRRQFSSHPAFYAAYCERHRAVMEELAGRLKKHVSEHCYDTWCMSDWMIPECYGASVKLGSEVLWGYLYHQYYGSWDTPLALGGRVDLTPVLNLLLE